MPSNAGDRTRPIKIHNLHAHVQNVRVQSLEEEAMVFLHFGVSERVRLERTRLFKYVFIRI